MMRQRVALITGASRGIGRAIAEQLADDGFDLTISARNPDMLEQAAVQLRASGQRIVAYPADLSVQHDVEILADDHLLNFENLDLLVLNAGIGYSGELCSFPIRKFDKLMEVNVRSPLLLIQRLLPTLRATALLEPEIGSKIIAISSITGMVGELDLAAYGASKAALISLCESIIVAESERGVSATSISPGYVDTDMTEWINDRIRADSMIRPKDIAILVSAISRLSRFASVPNVAVTRPGNQIWRA
jgi:NAD(P)-dependent dehydrogenase (short-subunit alcohol dehydrogenase family)